MCTNNYKLVAPDGGWGYMICVAVTINFVVTGCFQSCFGIIFNSFLNETKIGTAGVGLVFAFSAVSTSIAGYFTGALLKVMSLRKIAFLGAFIYIVGNVGVIFMRNEYELYLFQGVIQGIGNGFIYNTSCTILNQYFVKKRVVFVCLPQIIAAVLSMATPLLVHVLLEEFNFRGTLMFIAGFSTHTLLSAALMQPVELHLKKEYIDEINDESKRLTREPAHDSLNIDITLQRECRDENINKTGLWQKLSNALDWSLFSDVYVVSTGLGISICVFSEMTYLMILPQALYEKRWDKSTVAWSISLFGFFDLAGRVSLIFMNKLFKKLGSRSIYLIGLLVAILTRIGMLMSKNRKAQIVFISLMGLSRSTIMVLIPIVFSESVGEDKFASAMGIFMFMYGLITAVVGPTLGTLRDLTESYAATFHILNSLFAIVVIFWTIEICYRRHWNKKANQINQKNKGKINLKASMSI